MCDYSCLPKTDRHYFISHTVQYWYFDMHCIGEYLLNYYRTTYALYIHMSVCICICMVQDVNAAWEWVRKVGLVWGCESNQKFLYVSVCIINERIASNAFYDSSSLLYSKAASSFLLKQTWPHGQDRCSSYADKTGVQDSYI